MKNEGARVKKEGGKGKGKGGYERLFWMTDTQKNVISEKMSK